MSIEDTEHQKQNPVDAAILETLLEVGQSLVTLDDLDLVLNKIAEDAAAILEADIVVLYEYQEKTDDVYVPPVVWGDVWYPEILTERGRVRPHRESAVFRMLSKRRKRPVYAPDAKKTWGRLIKPQPQEKGRAADFLYREEIASSAAVRLNVQDERVGVLFVNYRTRHSFPAELRRNIELFATQAAIAIRNARLRAERERQIERLHTLNQVSRNLSAKLDRDAISEAVVNAVVQTLNCTHCTFFVVEDGYLVPAASHGKDAGLRVTRRFVLGEGLAGWTATTGEPILTNDAKLEKRFCEGETRPEVDRSMIVVPVKMEDQIMGVISVDQDRVNAFDEQDLQMVETLAGHAATAIQNARLYEQRVKDIEALREINEAITASEQADKAVLNEILQLVVDKLIDIFHGVSCAIRLWDPGSEVFGVRLASGILAKRVKHPPRFDGGSQTILATKEPLYAGDPGVRLPNGKLVIRPEIRREGIQSVAYLPLLSEGDVLGILYVEWDGPRWFSDNEKRVLELFAGQATVAIEHARQIEQRRADIATLQEINEAITAEAGPEIADLIVRKAQELMPAEYGALWLVRGKHLILEAASGREAKLTELAMDKPSINAWVAEKGEPYICPDVRNDPRYKSEFDDIRSSMTVPLRSGDHVIGTLAAESSELAAFSDYQLGLLQSLADQAAIAISNAHLFENTRARVRDLEIIDEVVGIMSTKLDTQGLFKAIVSQIAKKLQCSHCTLFLSREVDGETLLVPERTHGQREEVMTRKFKPGEGLVGRVFQQGKSRVLADAKTDPDYAPARDPFDQPHQPRSMLVVPVTVGDQTIGVISADQDKYGWFSESDRRLVDTLALQVGIAIERNRGFKLIQEVGAQITDLQVRDILEHIVTGAIKLTNTVSGIIYTISEDGKSVVDSFHPPGFEHPKPRLEKEEGLTRQVIESGKVISIPDIDQDERVNPVLCDPFRSMIAVPLKTKGNKVIGVLYLNDDNRHDFTETEISMLSTLATQAAVAIENTRLFQQQAELVKQLVRLQEVTTTISAGASTRENVLRRIVDSLSDLFSGATCSIMLYDSTTGEFGHRVAAGELAAHMKHSPRPKGSSRYVVEKRAPLYSEGASAKLPDGQAAIRKELEDKGVLAAALLPLLLEGDVIGVLYATLTTAHTFPQSEKLILELFANQAGVAIEHARRIDQRRADIATLQEINAAITTKEGQEIAGLIVQKIRELTDAEYGTLWLVAGESLALEAASGREARLTRLPIDEKSINGWVAMTGKSYKCTDVREDPHYISEFDDISSNITVPLRSGGHVIGTLSAENPRLEAFSDYQLGLLQSLADQAAIAIENARLYQQVRQQAEYMQTLGRAVSRIRVARDSQAILQVITDEACATLGADRCTVFVLDDKGALVPRAATGVALSQVDEYPLEAEENPISWVAREGQFLLTLDVAEDEGFAPTKPAEGQIPQRATLAPMWVAGRVTGVVCAEYDQTSAFSEDDRVFLEALAAEGGTAIQGRVWAVERRYNPYTIGEPIREPEEFFGRRETIQFVMDRIHNNNLIICGERRIGKTSFLYQLEHQLATLSTEDKFYYFLPVNTTLQGVPEDGFFSHLITRTARAADITLDDSAWSGEGAYDCDDFEDDLMAIVHILQGRHPGERVRIVLLLDEMDQLINYGLDMQERFRSLFTTRAGAHFGAVLAGVSIQRVTHIPTSPWYNLFREVALGSLDEDAAQQLVTEPVRGYYTYEDKAVGAILERSDLKPQEIQTLCSLAVEVMLDRVTAAAGKEGAEAATEQTVIELNDVLKATERALEHKNDEYLDLWHRYSEEQRRALRDAATENRAIDLIATRAEGAPLFRPEELHNITRQDGRQVRLCFLFRVWLGRDVE